MSFSFKDYIKMFKTKGWYLPYKYFLENHFFDLKRGLDTHAAIQKEYFAEVDNLKHGIHYACSWQSTIKKSFFVVLELLKEDRDNLSFIDIGCGKGKVPIVWNEIAYKHNYSFHIYGIDYSQSLINIAKKNYLKLFDTEGNFICSDITKVDFSQFTKKKLVFYLYNPFDEVILKKFLDQLKCLDVCIIYVYPIHDLIIKNSNYELVYNFSGKHPNEAFRIYLNKQINK